MRERQRKKYLLQRFQSQVHERVISVEQALQQQHVDFVRQHAQPIDMPLLYAPKSKQPPPLVLPGNERSQGSLGEHVRATAAASTYARHALALHRDRGIAQSSTHATQNDYKSLDKRIVHGISALARNGNTASAEKDGEGYPSVGVRIKSAGEGGGEREQEKGATQPPGILGVAALNPRCV